MIGLLKGKIAQIVLEKSYLILDINSVGYIVYTTTDTLLNNNVEDKLSLHTHMIVRETALDLYGFTTESEKILFELLLSVSGVGPKSALSILSIADESTIYTAVSTNEISYLTKVSGIGKKLAGKIVLELKDKLKDQLNAKENNSASTQDGSVMDALEVMGYKTTEAREAVKNIPDSIIGLNARVSHALKILGRNNK